MLIFSALAACLLPLPPARAGVAIGTGAEITPGVTDNKVYFGRYPQRFGPESGTNNPRGQRAKITLWRLTRKPAMLINIT